MRKFYQYFSIFILTALFVSCAKDEVDMTGSISGIVTDAAVQGKSIQGATVTLNPTGLKATTGSDGRYEFEDLEMGQYTVQVQAQGYVSTTMRVDVVAGKKSAGDIQLKPHNGLSKLELSVSSLRFGKDTRSLTFTLTNTGDKTTSWNISGLESWVTVSPTSGSLNAGRNQVVKVTVDRGMLDKTTSTSIIVNADEESVALPITVEVESETSLLKLNTSFLDFGTEYSELSFSIQNKGNAGSVDWTISGITVPWLTVSPKNGTTAMGKSSSVKVTVDRAQITAAQTTTILVNGNGESLSLAVSVLPGQVDEPRRIEVYPERIDFGTDKTSELFFLYSYNGATDYKLYTEGDASWLSFSSVLGTIPEYVQGNYETIKDVTAYADRTGLSAGKYSCTVIVRTDLGDLRIPVSMTVPTSGGGGTGGGGSTVSGTIESCDSRVSMKLLSMRKSGSTVTYEFSMTNNGSDLASVDLFNDHLSYAYDSDGGFYTYDGGVYNMVITFGGTSKPGVLSPVRKTFPSGATLKCEIKFTDVPSTVTSFTNVTIGIRTYASSWEFDSDKIVLRNLSL